MSLTPWSEAGSPTRTRFMGGSGQSVYVGTAGQIQFTDVVSDPQLQSKANNQFNTALEIHGRRGDIKSADGKLLATSVEVQSLHADPSKPHKGYRPSIGKGGLALAGTQCERNNQEIGKTTDRMCLSRDLVPDQVTAIMQKVDELTEQHPTLKHVLFTRNSYRRFYPAGADAASLLGVGRGTGNGLAGLKVCSTGICMAKPTNTSNGETARDVTSPPTSPKQDLVRASCSPSIDRSKGCRGRIGWPRNAARRSRSHRSGHGPRNGGCGCPGPTTNAQPKRHAQTEARRPEKSSRRRRV